MDLNTFWTTIEKSKRGAEDSDEQAEKLEELLKKLPPAEIISFDKHYRERLAEAYRWDLWGVAYIINGGCSDDGFDYFCDWLIAQGRDRFEKALTDPQSIGDYAESDECEAEAMRYAAQKAHEETTGKDLPNSGVDRPSDPAGEPWGEEEDDLKKLFPKVFKKFWA